MIHVPVSCVVNAGRVELFTDVPVAEDSDGTFRCLRQQVAAYVWSSVDQFPRQGRAGRGVTTGCRIVIIVCCRERGYVPVERWVVGPTVPAQQGVAVLSSENRRREQGPLLRR